MRTLETRLPTPTHLGEFEEHIFLIIITFSKFAAQFISFLIPAKVGVTTHDHFNITPPQKNKGEKEGS